MFAPNIFLFYLAFFFSLLLLIINSIMLGKFINIPITKKTILLVFLLAFFIRFFAVLFFPFASGYDISSFLWAGKSVALGKDIYQGLDVRFFYAFMPTLAIIVAFFLEISSIFNLSVVCILKFFIIFFDSLIALLLVLISKNIKNGLIYAFCSIPIVVSAYLGQFDAISILFILLSLHLFTRKKLLLSSLSLGISMTFKPWPLIFALLLFFKTKDSKDNFKILLGLIIPSLLVISIYKLLIPGANLKVMFGVITLYESVLGWWGPSIFFQKMAEAFGLRRIISIPAFFSKLITIGIIIYLCRHFRKKNIFVIGKWTILTIYIFSFGFSIHYLVWILPFILLTKDRMLKYYLVFVGIYFLFYGVFHLLDYNFTPPELPKIFYAPLSFLLWTFFLYWGINEIKRTR